MPLHIFEPRYQALVNDCLESDRPFGLIYHDWDELGPFMCEEDRVGCEAMIRKHHSLDGERSFIVVEGQDRFRISDGLESEALYFEALVEPYLDTEVPSKEALENRRKVSIELFREVVSALKEPPTQLPGFEPEGEVSFLLAQAVQINPSWHQELLELRDESSRLDRLDRVLRAALD